MSRKIYAFSTFDKQCSLFIKGIAIILMVCHHMWWYKEINDFSGIWSYLAPYIIALGKAGKVCVAIFTFISGYGLYLSFSQNKSYTNVFNKLKNILFYFWRTVIPLLFILFIGRIIPFKVKDFLLNMLCIDNSYNGAWWYLQTYLFYLILSPIVFSLIKSKISSIIICVLSMTLFRYIAHIFLGELMYIHYFFYYFPFFIIGAVFSKYNLLNRMSLSNRNSLSLFIYILITIFCLFIRFKTGCSEILFIIIPAFILIFIQKPIKNTILTRGLIYIGKYSMGIWLLHSFFIKQIPMQTITNNCLLHFILIFSISFSITYVTEKIRHLIIKNYTK